MIMTYFMALGERPVRSAAPRDAVPSGKKRNDATEQGRPAFGGAAWRFAGVAPLDRCPTSLFASLHLETPICPIKPIQIGRKVL